jgi:peptidoglycan/LPS O-acetylase OafA/YrhL
MVLKLSNRQNNFNLLRLTLALLVIFGHSPELTDGNRKREVLTRIFGTISFGELAVDGFFLLSGYLIMQSWDSQPEAWQFLKKRLLRIYPGFVIASLICAFIVGPLASNSADYFVLLQLPDLIGSIVSLQIPAIPPVFQGQPYANINGAMWTISREFSCYLFVLAAGALGAFRIRHFCLSLTVAVFIAMVALKLKNVPVMDLRLASFFLSGACYYRYRSSIRLAGPLAVAMTVICFISLFSWRASELVLATIGGYALVYAAGRRSVMLSHFNRLPDVSYGVYLYGWPIQKLLLWYAPTMSPWMLFALSAPAAILAGSASWYLIEKPALRFKGPSLQIQNQQEERLVP